MSEKIVAQISLLRAIEREADAGMRLLCGRGDISLELTPEEVETAIRPLLQARRGALGMQLANSPKNATHLVTGSGRNV